jgi:uncharacterized protein (TIGR02453 family)
MTSNFDGFPPGFFKFFKELKLNNNREWFNDNKPRYKDVVVEPSCAFIEAMAPKLEKISPYFVADPRPNGGSMFRIYRDVRFSKDKKPYKENVGFQFRHHLGKNAHAPGFYVGLSPKETHHGGGIWHPPAPNLKKIRDGIVEDPDGWKKVITNKTLKSRAGGVSGVALVRPPRGYDGDETHVEDLKRKSFFAMTEGKVSEAKSKEFVSEVTKSFKAASPLIKFLSAALDVDF